jgi:hypothetical protein
MEPEEVQWWRYMWVATLPDGKKVSQFTAEGKKVEWKHLPTMPSKVDLVPFNKALALKVRSVSHIPALDSELLPVELENLGRGIMAGQDQRRYSSLQTAECQVCKHRWTLTEASKAVCPNCHVRDEWFCALCQTKKEPLWIDKKALCPDCKSRGKTFGLKRLMNFKLFGSSFHYLTHYWIRSPPVELRVIPGELATVHHWDQELAKIIKDPE